MELSTCRFYCGEEIQFAVFSDAACRACYLEHIPVPFGSVGVDAYEIKPGTRSRWIVIRQKEGNHSECKWFMRKGSNFVERPRTHIPKKVKAEVFHKFPLLAEELSAGVG